MVPGTAYRQALLLLTLALVVAACTPAGPAADDQVSPSPAQPTPTSQSTPASQPTPSAAPSPTLAAASATPTAIDYDYDYDYGATTPPPAEPTAALIDIAQDGGGGDYLVGPNGMALYVFTQDQPGVSNCTGSCAEAWPPLIVESGEELTAAAAASAELAVIERGSGALQVTYAGMPLYYYVGDQAPGDTSGDEVGGVWFLARP